MYGAVVLTHTLCFASEPWVTLPGTLIQPFYLHTPSLLAFTRTATFLMDYFRSGHGLLQVRSSSS